MPFDVKQYLSQLAKDAGVDDAKLQAALEVVGNEKVSKALSDGFLRQEDYSRNMDGLKTKQTELTNWYNEQLKVAQTNQEIVANANKQLGQYKELYGDLDGTNRSSGTVDTSQFIDKKTLDEKLNTVSNQFLTITEQAVWAAGDYMAKFKEPLPIEDLKKYAIESGLPLKAAYEKFIEPRIKEIDNKTWEEKLRKAKEEGVTEGLSQRVNPTSPGNPEPNGFIANLRKSQKEGATTLRQGFAEEWNKAAAQ